MDAEETMKLLMGNPNEPINPDLAPFLEQGSLGEQLRHPLVYQVPLWSYSLANKMYAQKKKEIAVALREEQWSRFIFLHERPYRLQAFQEIQDRLTDIGYWHLLGEVWIDTENAWQSIKTWRSLFNSKRSHSHYIMDEVEQEMYGNLPSKFTIYRGCSYENENGISWTLDKDKAEFFANRCSTFGRKGKVIYREIDKKNTVALLLGRNEQEIIVRNLR